MSSIPFDVPGFWCRTADGETRIGAVHRSPRIVGASLAMVIWILVFWRPLTSLRAPALYDVAASAFGLLIGFFFARHLLDLLLGYTEIRIRGEQAEVYSGVWKFGKGQTFTPGSVSGIGGHQTSGGFVWTELAGTPAVFGDYWTEPRRLAVVFSLADALGVPRLPIATVEDRQRAETAAAAETADTAPPRGAWCTDDGQSLRLGITTRTLTVIPFAIIAALWNAAMIALVILVIRSGHYWPLLFALLHIAVGVFMAWSVIHSVFGRVELRLSGDECEVFEGVGRFRSYQRFRISSVTSVRQVVERASRSSTVYLMIDAQPPVTLAHSMSDKRRRWLRSKLHRLLVSKKP